MNIDLTLGKIWDQIRYLNGEDIKREARQLEEKERNKGEREAEHKMMSSSMKSERTGCHYDGQMQVQYKMMSPKTQRTGEAGHNAEVEHKMMKTGEGRNNGGDGRIRGKGGTSSATRAATSMMVALAGMVRAASLASSALLSRDG